jgi:hypothetical protein
MDINYYGRWNWPNTWRLAFLLLGLGWFFTDLIKWVSFGHLLGGVGGFLFVVLFIVRFEDVQKAMDSRR